MENLDVLQAKIRILAREDQDILNNNLDLLTSALDAIADTECAIDFFIKRDTKDEGELYLLIYGLLQTFYVQQEAAKVAHKIVFNDNLELSETLKYIRGVRNDTIAHPFDIGDNRHPRKACFISRAQLDKESFVYFSSDNNYDEIQQFNIKISELILDQSKEMSKILIEIFNYLNTKNLGMGSSI